MDALARRQPLIAAALLARANRFHAAPRAARLASAVLLAAVLVVIVGTLMAAAHHRLGNLPAALRWWLAAGFGLWAAMWSRERFRCAITDHHRGWMQAWPLPPRTLMLQEAALAAASVLAVAVWPAAFCGLLMASGAGSQAGWNLAACCLGVLVGTGLGQWPAPVHAATADAAPLRSRVGPADSFIGLAQLREWQRCAIGRLSLRRWVLWTAPVLLMAPSHVGVQAGAQILLLVLGWPLYARAMAASLETISAAARLLAATPLAASSLCRPLLLRPTLLALSLAIVVAIDLTWLRLSAASTAAVCVLILLFEGGRMANRYRYACHTVAACVKPVGASIQERA